MLTGSSLIRDDELVRLRPIYKSFGRCHDELQAQGALRKSWLKNIMRDGQQATRPRDRAESNNPKSDAADTTSHLRRLQVHQ